MRTGREAGSTAPPSRPGGLTGRAWLGRAEVRRLRALLDEAAGTPDPEVALDALAETLARVHLARLRAVAAALTPADASR